LGYATPTVINQRSDPWIGNVNVFDSNNLTAFRSNILRVNSPVCNQQYFLIENRRMATTSRWDAGLYRWLSLSTADNIGGVMVFHIDESMRRTDNRDNANWRRRLVDVVEADGFNDSNPRRSFLDLRRDPTWRDAGDHFFRAGARNHSVFGPNTNPNTNFYEPRRHPNNYSLEQGVRDVATGITMTVRGVRSNSMQVEIRNPLPEVIISTHISGQTSTQFTIGRIYLSGTGSHQGRNVSVRINNTVIAQNITLRESRTPIQTNRAFNFGQPVEITVHYGSNIISRQFVNTQLFNL